MEHLGSAQARLGRWTPTTLVALGVVSSGVALLDPAHPSGRWLGPLLCGLGFLAATGRRRRGLGLGFLLAAAFALGAWADPDFAADSHSYFVYLRSAAFDHDLDFSNDWARWGFDLPRHKTHTGVLPNMQSVGPAVLWSPFYLIAHGYAALDTALGAPYEKDGYSLPYRRSTALGTITIALAGAWALVRMLERRHGRPTAVVAVAGAVGTSPILYYVFVMPAMAHGIAFGLTGALLWAWDRARRAPSAGAWALVGTLLGLLAMTRWQAAVCAVPVALVALEDLWRRSVRAGWLLGGAAAAAVAFAPQLVAWKLLFGKALTIPQGTGFVDWSSPHLLDTLISADHGFFSWTPAMLVGFAGVLLGLHRHPRVHGAALFVLAATAFVNGAVSTWTGGDAFGARRFDICVPFAALGLATLVENAGAFLRRAPRLLPAAALLAMGLWNVGFIASFREGQYPSAAPIDRLAADQARHLRLGAQRILGWIFGPRGSALAYKYFDGEYVFSNYAWDGTLNLATLDERDLSGSWSQVRRKPGGPSFRWAIAPSSCVRVPLEEPRGMPVAVAARSPLQPQEMTLLLNGHAARTVPVGTGWSEVRAWLPTDAFVPGENVLCLQFSSSAPPDDQGTRVAAQVARVRLR